MEGGGPIPNHSELTLQARSAIVFAAGRNPHQAPPAANAPRRPLSYAIAWRAHGNCNCIFDNCWSPHKGGVD